jgi:hypothetical protein
VRQSQQEKPRIKKPKLLRSNTLRYYLINYQGWHPTDLLIEDEDIILNNRRLRVKDSETIDDLSDYVKFRLWLARQLALKKFNEKWG